MGTGLGEGVGDGVGAGGGLGVGEGVGLGTGGVGNGEGVGPGGGVGTGDCSGAVGAVGIPPSVVSIGERARSAAALWAKTPDASAAMSSATDERVMRLRVVEVIRSPLSRWRCTGRASALVRRATHPLEVAAHGCNHARPRSA